MVVTGELIWLLFLNIISFNYVQTTNKSLRFRKFRRSYTHPSNQSLWNVDCFFSWCALLKATIFHFLLLFVRNDSVFAWPIFVEHTRYSDFVNSKVGKKRKRCEILIHEYMITNKQLDASISSAAEQRFLLIPILQRRQPNFLSLHLDMVGIELHCNIHLQRPKCYIPLELACCFFVA